MDLARIRHLVIWATVSLAVLSVIYAPKRFFAWSNQSNAWVIPPDREYGSERARGYGREIRDFFWISHDGSYERYIGEYTAGKYTTDWSRIMGELILIIGIGGGLVFALRDKRKP